MKNIIISVLLLLSLLCSCSTANIEEGSKTDVDSSSKTEQSAEGEEDVLNVEETAEGFVTEVNTKSVRYLGRVYPNLVKTRDCFAYPSSGIEFTFEGTRLEADIYTSSPTNIYKDQLRVAVYIDDFSEPYKILSLEEYHTWYTLAEGLSDTTHKAKIVRINGYGHNHVAVSHIRTEKSGVRPSEKRELYIEFIGDSITAGHGIEGGEKNSASVENSELTYAALTAKHFDADYSLIARSGVSLVYGYGGSKGDLATMYEKWDFYNGKSDVYWDFANNRADIVVINVGTNDYWAGVYGQADETAARNTFCDGYYDFLKLVREKQPNATIIACLGPMTYKLMEEIELAVSKMNEYDGDLNVYALKLEPKNPAASDGVGTENHPSVITNKKMSETLIKAMQKFAGLE